MSTAAATSRTRRLAQHPSGQRPTLSRTFRRKAAAVAAALSLSLAAGIAASSALPTSATSYAAPGDPPGTPPTMPCWQTRPGTARSRPSSSALTGARPAAPVVHCPCRQIAPRTTPRSHPHRSTQVTDARATRASALNSQQATRQGWHQRDTLATTSLTADSVLQMPRSTLPHSCREHQHATI